MLSGEIFRLVLVKRKRRVLQETRRVMKCRSTAAKRATPVRLDMLQVTKKVNVEHARGTVSALADHRLSPTLSVDFDAQAGCVKSEN